MAEQCAHQYVKDYSLRVISLQFASVYGSRKDKSDKVIPTLMFNALNDKNIMINNGLKSFDFIHIDDLIRGIIISIGHAKNLKNGCFERIPLCTGNPINLEQLSSLIVKECHSASKITIKTAKNGNKPKTDFIHAEKKLGFRTQLKIIDGIREMLQTSCSDYKQV